MGNSPHTQFAGLSAICGMNSHSTSLQRKAFPAARLLLLVVGCFFASPLSAQIASQPVPPPVQLDSQKLTMAELSQLLAPIALYPDALIALILPASTVPSDVVLGARFVKANGDPANVENKPWDESVKSLSRYPDVLTWLDENLEWTASVGEAFVEQPADVMNAIQGLREQARAAGHLVDTPQQKVLIEEEVIRIIPADPEVIYVPVYDPQVVYVESYTTVPVLTFGLGFAVGSWLTYDFDWNRRCVYRGNWRGWNRGNNWNGDRNGNRDGVNVVNIDINNANRWQPSANAQRQTNQRQRNNNGNARYANTRTAGVTQPAARQNTSPQTIVYNPASNPALPRPTNLERTSRENPRDQAPGRSGTTRTDPAQAGTLPPAPEGRPDRADRPRTQTPEGQNEVPRPPLTDRPNPGTTPDRPSRTRPTPSAAPEVPGQIKNPGQPARPDLFAPETPTAIREERPSASQPSATPRSKRESTPNPARNTENRDRTATPTAPPPQVPGQLTNPGQSRNKEPRQPKQPDRVAPVAPTVPAQEKQSAPRPQQAPSVQNPRPEAPRQPRVTAPQEIQQPAPATKSQPPPQATERQQRPPQVQRQQQPPQQPPQQRPAPAQQPQAPAVQQAPTQQRPAPAPKPQAPPPQQAPTQQRPAPAPKIQAPPPQQPQAVPQTAPALPVPAAPPGADRDRKRKD